MKKNKVIDTISGAFIIACFCFLCYITYNERADIRDAYMIIKSITFPGTPSSKGFDFYSQYDPSHKGKLTISDGL